MNDTRYWQAVHESCTPNQIRVLQLKAQGMSLRQIAAATTSSISTVRGHLEAARHNTTKHLKENAA